MCHLVNTIVYVGFLWIQRYGIEANLSCCWPACCCWAEWTRGVTQPLCTWSGMKKDVNKIDLNERYITYSVCREMTCQHKSRVIVGYSQMTAQYILRSIASKTVLVNGQKHGDCDLTQKNAILFLPERKAPPIFTN